VSAAKKKTIFPASRELFRLVRAVADSREIREEMSDVDIGRLVGFESSRTSRWKHGQISVADAARLVALSQSLDLDLTVLTHVAAGYLSADEALELLFDENKLVRFLGEQIVLPLDQQVVSLTGGEGVTCRVTRRRAGQYRRQAKRIGGAAPQEETDAPVVLLADDDRSTIDVFENLTGPETGVVGAVARSAPEALLKAGRLAPQLVIFDLFLGQADGFGALKSLAVDEATREAEVFATSLSVTPEVVRNALGCGALDVIQRPLRARVLARLIGRLRR
jgi:CheY-like chemotaxis protein